MDSSVLFFRLKTEADASLELSRKSRISFWFKLMDFTVHGILQARILEWVAFPFSRDLPNPGIEPRSPALQADSLSAESQGKPKKTGVLSLSLLLQIFPTQESNWGLLHCRRILYTRE